MRSRRIGILIIVIISIVLCSGLPKVFGAIIISDGQTHNIDYAIDDSLWIDYEAPGVHTTVNMLDGSSIEYWLEPYGDSRLNIIGSYSGRAGLRAFDRSQVEIYAGWMGDYLQAWDNTRINMSGGTLLNELVSDDSAVLTIHGSDFAVDGQPFGYGELTSLLGGYSYDEPVRHLTGTLANGESIDNDFYIGKNASIVLIPEPATLLLLGLGAVMVRKRR